MNRLYGRNSVLERLKTNPKSIKNIFIERDAKLPELIHITKINNIPLRYFSEREFRRFPNENRNQGIVAEVEDFRYTSFESILDKTKDKLPILLFLDNLNDPQNFGGILRTAACFGGFAVVIPVHNSVAVTDAVLRVAQGGENYVPIAKVSNLSLAIRGAKEAGYWIAGAVVNGGCDLTGATLNFPLGLVIGSEGKGIREGLLKHLDFRVTLPMALAKLSFNVAVITAIFCYEIVRQKKKCRS